MIKINKDSQIIKWRHTMKSQHQHSGSISVNNSLKAKLDKLNNNDFSRPKSENQLIFEINGHPDYS